MISPDVLVDCSVDIVGNFSSSTSQQDCDGHGTHVASIAMGHLVGVAKEASAVAVRVLDCNVSSLLLYFLHKLYAQGQHPHIPCVHMARQKNACHLL